MTSESVDKLCQALMAGNFRSVACEWAGISFRAMRDWMQRGKQQKKGKFRDFRRRVLEAEKQAEIRVVGLVMKAAAEDPKHGQWWLERKFPERWGRKDVRVVGDSKRPIQIESKPLAQLTRDELLAIASLPDATE
jgi:hypothetical protein